MAGKLVVDTIDTDNAFITLNVQQSLIATMNVSGIYSNTGVKMIGANGTVSNTAITGNIISSQITSVANTQITGNIISSQIAPSVTLTTPIISGNLNLDSAGTTGIRVPSANAISFHTAGTEDMRIDATGNVGIGTASPATKLDVVNTQSSGTGAVTTVRLNHSGTTAGDGPRLLFTSGDSTTGGCAIAGSGVALNSADMLFYAGGNTERMRINSSGNVGIGTSSPGIKLQVVGNGSFSDTLQVFNTPSSSAHGILFRNTFNTGGSIFSTGAATTNDFVLWVGGSGTQGGITGNGAGINYSSASDYRLKQNIAPMTGALAKVALLKPCTYTWKFDGSDGQGFIAHELDEVFPDAVTGEKDAVETYTDEDGNEQTKIKPQGVDTSFLVATLTAAIQEQQAIIADLKARIEALEA
jgi:hypothetical protein